MLGDSRQASSATTSLIFITVGALTFVWSIVYLVYLRNHGGTDIGYLYVSGFICTGAVLFLIGLAVGRIGYSARAAEVAPTPTQQVVTSTPVVAAAVPSEDPNLTAPVSAPAATLAPSAADPAPKYVSANRDTPSQLIPNA